jgi:hypothetical protein
MSFFGCILARMLWLELVNDGAVDDNCIVNGIGPIIQI